jgi:hypothetical protein
MLFRALVFGTRLIRRGDRAELLLKATCVPPSRQPFDDASGHAERWRFDDTGVTTIFIIRSRRIVSIEQGAA